MNKKIEIEPPKRLVYGVRETAVALGIGVVTVYALLRDHRLTRLKVGRRTLIPVEDVERLAKSGWAA